MAEKWLIFNENWLSRDRYLVLIEWPLYGFQVTTPGWKCKYNGTDEMKFREEMGMWGGPSKVISNLGIMEFDEVTHEMYCSKYYENLGVTPQDIIDNTGFDIDVSRAVPFELPTEEELDVLRRIDKDKIFIG